MSRTESGERPLHLDEAESLARVLGLPLVEDGAIMDELAKADALIAAQEAEIARLTRLYSAYRKDVAAAESTISRIRDAVDEHQERRLPSVDDPKSSQVNASPFVNTLGDG